MEILKIKDWKKRKNQIPQFEPTKYIYNVKVRWSEDEFRFDKTIGDKTILSVSRIKDRQIFELGEVYQFGNGFVGEFRILKFHDDLIHVDCQYNNEDMFTDEINCIQMKEDRFIGLDYPA